MGLVMMSAEALAVRIRVDDEARALFAALADVLVPAHGEFPSASKTGVAAENLDKVLVGRPDRVDALISLLHALRDVDPRIAVILLERHDSAGFAMLIEVVTAAYVLDAEVEDALDYHGQEAKEINVDRPDYVDLIDEVLARGPIHRVIPS